MKHFSSRCSEAYAGGSPRLRTVIERLHWRIAARSRTRQSRVASAAAAPCQWKRSTPCGCSAALASYESVSDDGTNAEALSEHNEPSDELQREQAPNEWADGWANEWVGKGVGGQRSGWAAGWAVASRRCGDVCLTAAI